jgi:DNA-binding transcriptional regulator GbsR (MarR family)
MKVKHHETRLKAESFPALRETADLIGEFIQYWGFKKVHGRIWSYIFLSEEPLNTRQLVDLLKISNALVSISVSELQKYGVILEAGKGRNGVLLYRANPDVGAVIAGVLLNREQKLLGRIQSSVKKMSAVDLAKKKRPIRIAEKRMQLLEEWVEIANTFLQTGVDYLESST